MKIQIVDDLPPEDVAMLQALYSRSAESVDTHLEKVRASGSGKFMSTYYVGYGHKSIADCGSTTIFVEGVSLLAAKAIQDWPLYSGQETSTRYVDMSKQPIVDPVGTAASKEILDRWMDFYLTRQKQVDQLVRLRHPKRADEKEETYDRAVTARVFDILRGFLPAGITTQLSWHTNLRQADDHLTWLFRHPLPEVVAIAKRILDALDLRYPSSRGAFAGVSGVSNRDETALAQRAAWNDRVASTIAYPATSVANEIRLHSSAWLQQEGIENLKKFLPYEELLATRPRGCLLPHFLTDLGQLSMEFLLDFGSFRDLQRHRNGVVRMPKLGPWWGFDHWYLQQLGDPHTDDVGGLRDVAVQLIHEQQERIRKLGVTAEIGQYYCALGFKVPCQVTMALPALVYFLELRSGKTVHPTLRARVLKIVETFKERYPNIALHADLDPDDWTVRRGEQTITRKS